MNNPDRLREIRPQTKAIVDAYFRDHPEAWDGVERAWYAYHAGHPRLHSERVHFFSGADRTHRCMWCQRTREQVRWDDLTPQCAEWRQMPDVEQTIAQEESNYFVLLGRMEKEMPRLWKKFNGDTLAIYQTHGFPEDMQRDWFADQSPTTQETNHP